VKKRKRERGRVVLASCFLDIGDSKLTMDGLLSGSNKANKSKVGNGIYTENMEFTGVDDIIGRGVCVKTTY